MTKEKSITEEISQKICEKCGIEPIKLTGCSFVNLRKYGIEEGTDVCIHMEEEHFECKKCKFYNTDEELFPDFGEPENFVRLYELQITQKTTLSKFLCTGSMIVSDRIDFLNEVFMLVNDGYEDLINAIMAQRWDYE